MARRDSPAAHATAEPISILRACPAIRTGTWRPRRWRGRASRSATSATSSRTPAQRQPRHRGHSQARGDRQPGEVGLESGAGPYTGTRHQRGVRCAAAGLGRYRRALPGALSACGMPASGLARAKTPARPDGVDYAGSDCLLPTKRMRVCLSTKERSPAPPGWQEFLQMRTSIERRPTGSGHPDLMSACV